MLFNFVLKEESMAKILLIEDDFKLQKYLKEYLMAYENKVILIEDFNRIIETVDLNLPDLILLDINLPKFDGFYYLKLLKKKYAIPIIILSAISDEGEQIRGINMGADDYITKPFSIGILIAKINSLIKKSIPKENNIINSGEITLIKNSMQLKYKKEVIELTKNEFKLMIIFLNNLNSVIEREILLEELWDDMNFVDDNTLSVNITRIKKKLNIIGLKNVITTKRGIGYVFNWSDN
jgi:DNA-binding response OmpR family regulator